MIDIVLVNWNSGGYLKKCIQSACKGSNLQYVNSIFIIDNNSADDSLDNLPTTSKISVIKNKENVGFSRACNQGFKLCTSTYVLLLNPDTQLHENTLEKCIEFMNMRQDVDILGCQLIGDDGNIAKSCARFPTALRMCYEAIGLAKVAPKLFTPASLMTDWDHTSSRFVDQVMGAFMFMRTAIFTKAGYFDERFFVYYEELDFSNRIAKLGGRSYYDTGIRAVHSGAGTTRDVKGYRLFLNLRSRLQYSKKHFSYPGYASVWASTLLIEPFSRVLFSLLRGKFREVKDVLKGFRLLVKSLPL